jgi:hypothetical protein
MIIIFALALAASTAPADESADSAARQAWAACLAERVEALDTPTEPVDTVVQAAFAACVAQEDGLEASTLTQLKASNRERLTGIVLRVRQMNERAQELNSR